MFRPENLERFGDNQQGLKDLDHPIFRGESVESTPNSHFELQVGQIRKSTSTLNSANGSAHAPEESSLSAESIIDSSARDALLQLAIPNQNFKVMQHIGEGGQGDSYLLVNEKGEQFKAKILKEVPKKALYCSKEELADYLPEVKYFSKLDIKGVAKVIGAYSVEDPNQGRVVVVVSKYVEGETLQTKIRKSEPEQGLGVSETFNLLVKLSTSLAELHSDTRNEVGQRIVHGDLKPANIVLSHSGDPTLIDFGSTKAVTPGQTEQFTMGTSGLHSVSPPYSPLEQYLGKRIPASDIYALGVTAIECLLGRIPQELREAVGNMQPFVVKPSATIPKPLAVILTKMLAAKSEDRYQDGQELLEALRQAEKSIVKNSALPTKPGLLVRGVQALWRGLSHALRALRGKDGYISGAATTTQIDSHQASAPLEALPQGVAEQVITAELPDDRAGFAPHRAYLFSVAASEGTVLDELKTLLGKAAANQLAKDWAGSCNLDQKLEATDVALFLDSNNKARNRKYADRGDRTTQEEDFKATGHQFAGDLAATLLCARIFRKVQDKVLLSEGEQDLYQKLKDGFLRSCSGALAIHDDGRLRAPVVLDRRRSGPWALGSPLSRELK